MPPKRANRILASPALLLGITISLLASPDPNRGPANASEQSSPSAAVSETVPDNSNLLSLSVEQLSRVNVTTAALHQQLIKWAPADITVVAADEIQRYGWRTLGEVVNHVRGFYVTYDHTYQEAGAAGYSIPGDWSTRILVLVDGHDMTDNVFGSASYFDEDFVIDMTLVDRIEILRGASSSLYGSNGVLATINVITKRPGSTPGFSTRLETSTLGRKRGTLKESWKRNRIAVLTSATVFNDSGQHDIYIPEYSSPATNYGHAVNMDGDRGYRLFADLTAGNWEILAFAGTRVKTQPISWVDTVFNDSGTRAIDHRAAVIATWTRKFGEERTLNWANAWDQYTYRGIYLYPLAANDDVTGASGIDTNKEYDAGQWLTSTVTYRLPFLHGDLTAGGEARLDLQAVQSEADVLPVYTQQVFTGRRDRSTAGFLQQEWRVGTRWDFNVGSRYDWSYYRGSALSPRGGIVFQATPQTTLKLIYGRGFRNPNQNELFFSVPGQNAANPSLKPEQADSFEAGLYHNITTRLSVSLTAYQIVDHRIIVPVYTPDGASEFVNAGHFHGRGVGAEIQARPRPWMEVNAGFEQQQSWLDNRATLPNSPRSLGKLRLSVPLKGPSLALSGGLLYEGERRSLAGERIDPVWLPEITLVSKNLPRGIDLQLGLRNLSNSRYVDPIGLTSSVDTIRQPGRTFFMTVQHRF